jgi:hypothetical protein
MGRTESLLAHIEGCRGDIKDVVASKRFGYVYMTNQKAACSTVKLVLLRAERDDPTYNPATVHNARLMPTIEAEEMEALLGGGFRFTFVRNPYARLASAYESKIAVRAITDLRERAAKAYGIGLEALRKLPFADWVGFLERQDPRQMDRHWRPQVINTCHGIVEHHFVGKVESFDEDMSAIAASLGFRYASMRAGRRTGAGDNLSRYYTPDVAERVYALYREDFEAFDYGAQLPSADSEGASARACAS